MAVDAFHFQVAIVAKVAVRQPPRGNSGRRDCKTKCRLAGLGDGEGTGLVAFQARVAGGHCRIAGQFGIT